MNTQLDNPNNINVSVMSFAYNHGLPQVPVESCLYVFDCRTIRDPMWDSFSQYTGLDTYLVDHFKTQQPMIDFWQAVWNFTRVIMNQSLELQQPRDVVFAFGCTHGRHRSVYCAQTLAVELSNTFSLPVQCQHRDLDSGHAFFHTN